MWEVLQELLQHFELACSLLYLGAQFLFEGSDAWVSGLPEFSEERQGSGWSVKNGSGHKGEDLFSAYLMA